MPAHGDDAACTGAGVRKPSMKETAMGKHGRCHKLGLCRPRDARAGGVATFRFAVRPPRCPLPLRGALSPHAAEQVRTWDDSRQASGFRARSGPHFGRHARCAPQAHGNLGIRRPCLGRNRRDLCLRSGRRDRSDQNAAEYDIFEGRVSCRRPTIPIPKSNFRG